MPENLPIPTIAEVQRIVTVADPVVRNLQITQCYHELAAVLAARTGPSANWCTFATWASKQAGQTIRKEDLARLLESGFRRSPPAVRATEWVASSANQGRAVRVEDPQEVALTAVHFRPASERASEAVGRGNKKVFEEIGYEFARFYETCLPDRVPDPDNLARFCEGLRAGEPPDGQSYLRRAFTHYYQALFESDGGTRAQLLLLANVEIGFHEQTRLQPEIAESLEAGFASSGQLARLLLAGIFPYGGWLALANLYLRRLLRRPTTLDRAIATLLAVAGLHLRKTITELMMTISLPSGARLRLGEDLQAAFPDTLQEITNAELKVLLDKCDPTPDSVRDSGVVDWADLPDRLHFIVDLFRCYQEERALFAPPFTVEQVAVLKGGRRPAGRL